MRCSANRLLQLATNPRLQSMRLDTSSQVRPSASSKINRARRASSARSVRLWARLVSSISSEFVNVIASFMDTIIVYKWLLQSTSELAAEGANARYLQKPYSPTALGPAGARDARPGGKPYTRVENKEHTLRGRI